MDQPTAIKDLDENGSGFIYYPNRSVAMTISAVNDHQSCVYAFDCDKRTTMLLGVDENATGLMTTSKRHKNRADGSKIVCLTPQGGLLSTDGRISYEWNWSTEANPRLPAFSLNEYISIETKAKDAIHVSFKCGNVTHTCNVGLRLRRTDNYLEKAERTLEGKIVPSIERVTLRERQRLLSESLLAQRNKVRM